MMLLFIIVYPLFAAAALTALSRRHDGILDTAAAVFAAVEAAAVLAAQPGELTIPLLSGLTFRADGFRLTYALVTALLWLGTSVFSRDYFRHERAHMGSYWCFVFVTLAAAEGVMLSGDYLTTFLCFEVLSFSSFPWVMHERTPEAIRAGSTYLAVAVIGGLVLFLGLLLLQNEAGTLDYAALAGRGSDRLIPAAVCILLGFGAKAGMFPLHVWLPKAHPVAPAPASALLSGLLTKVGVYGILMTVWNVLPDNRTFGRLVLVLGLITMALGAVLALFSVNLKRTLACSSMSQIGFILTGAAAAVLNRSCGGAGGAALADAGLVLHMVNHSFLKLVLFLAAGAVAMNLHALNLNDIRGWGRNKPVLRLCFAVAALGISGVPLFNGYLSKTLLHEGIVHLSEASVYPAACRLAEAVFLASGGLTFAYMLKLYVCLFLEKNIDQERQKRYENPGKYMTFPSAAVLILGAAALLALGQPAVSLPLSERMTGLNLGGHFAAFAPENLKGSAISLSIGALAYLGFVRRVLLKDGVYRDLWPRAWDLEEALYRPLLLRWLPGLLGVPARALGENAVLRPVCLALAAGSEYPARAAGESRILGRVFRALALTLTVLGRLLDHGTDALILLLRRTLLRERRVRDEKQLRRPLPVLRRATALAASQVVDNFSFAMMMTCVGIILIFCTLGVVLL